MANGNKSLLAATLFVDDAAASKTVAQFLDTLKLTDAQIDRLGKGSNFGRDIANQLDIVDRQTKKTAGLLSGAFSPQNIVGGAAFGVVVRGLLDTGRAALDAEKSNRLLASSAVEAGKSYAILAEQNERFAAAAGLSETKAAGTLAKIQQLSTFSGGKTSTEDLTRSFLDLGAAKGINSADLETLIGSILSGQDEGLNRLGIADPGKLYEAYADKVGKTSDALTQFEKVQASVNAVQEKAGIFAGANADKMNTMTGRAERASATLQNLQADFGTNILSSREFKDSVDLLSTALGGLSINTADVQKKLAKGLTPKQIAEEQAEGFGAQAFDFFKNASGAGLGSILYGYDLVTEGFETANNRFNETIRGAKKRRIESDTKDITAQKALDEKKDRDALDQKAAFAARDAAQADKEHKAELARIRERAIEKAIAGSASIADVRKLQSGLNEKEIGRSDFESQNDKINSYIEKSIKGGVDKVKEVEKAITEAIEGISNRYGTTTENPFVAVFQNADKALLKLRESIAGLDPEMQRSLTGLVERLNELDLAKSRLDNSINSSSLRGDAANILNPIDEKASQRQEDRFKRQFLAANPNYLFLQQQEFEGGNRTGSDRTAGKSFEQFINEDLERRAGYGIETADERQAKRLAEQIKIINKARGDGSDAQLNALVDRKLIALTNGIDPNKLDDSQRGEAASARIREAERLERAEQQAREVEKNKAEALGDIRDNLGSLLKIAETEGLGGVVRIIDETKGSTKTEVKKPMPADTEAKYKQNFGTFSGGGTLSSF